MPKLHLAVALLLDDPDRTQAVRAATLALAHAKNQRDYLEQIIRDYPALIMHEWFEEIATWVRESGNLSLY